MLKHLKAFALWLLPILKTTSLAVAADAISEMAYPARARRTSYSQMRPYSRYKSDRFGETNTSLDDARRQAGLSPLKATANLGKAHREAQESLRRAGNWVPGDEHEITVRFKIAARSRLSAISWLMDNLPSSGFGPGDTPDENVNVAYWVIVDSAEEL